MKYRVSLKGVLHPVGKNDCGTLKSLVQNAGLFALRSGSSWVLQLQREQSMSNKNLFAGRPRWLLLGNKAADQRTNK